MNIQPKIVVFEDNEKTSDLLKEHLTASNYDVEVGDDLPSLKTVISKNHLDAAIVDIMIKDKPDGLKAIKELRKRKKDLYIEAQTGFLPTYSKQALESGADVVISKSEATKGMAGRIYQGVYGKKINRLEGELGLVFKKPPRSIFSRPQDVSRLISKANILLETLPTVKLEIDQLIKEIRPTRSTPGRVSADMLRLISKEIMGFELENPKLSESELNKRKYFSEKKEITRKYLNQYVAIIKGEIVFSHKNIKDLYAFVKKKHPDEEVFIKLIESNEEPSTVSIPSSFD